MKKKKIENEVAAVEETPVEQVVYPPHSVRIYPKPLYEENNEEVKEEAPAPEIERPQTKKQAKIDAIQKKLDDERAKLNAKLDLKQAKIDAIQEKEDIKNAKRLAKKNKN